MDGRLLDFLTPRRSETLADGLQLQVLSAQALLEARREAAELPQAEGLGLSACILARSLRRDAQAVYASGAAVLAALSAETITALTERYTVLAGSAEQPDVKTLQALLGQEDAERLKWRVLRAFGVLPSEPRAAAMTGRDYLLCAMQMALDEQEALSQLCPACREKAGQSRCICCGAPLAQINAGFDEKRYEELKHGRLCGAASAQEPGADGADPGAADP